MAVRSTKELHHRAGRVNICHLISSHLISDVHSTFFPTYGEHLYGWRRGGDQGAEEEGLGCEGKVRLLLLPLVSCF